MPRSVPTPQEWPSGHLSDAVKLNIPWSPQTLPSGQGKHDEISVEPFTVEYVPGGHNLQVTESARDLYVPASQILGSYVP